MQTAHSPNDSTAATSPSNGQNLITMVYGLIANRLLHANTGVRSALLQFRVSIDDAGPELKQNYANFRRRPG